MSPRQAHSLGDARTKAASLNGSSAESRTNCAAEFATCTSSAPAIRSCSKAGPGLTTPSSWPRRRHSTRPMALHGWSMRSWFSDREGAVAGRNGSTRHGWEGETMSTRHRAPKTSKPRSPRRVGARPPTFGGSPGGRRLVLPVPSCRGRKLPLGFEPVVPVGASGLAPRQPEVVGVERDLLGGGTPVRSPRAEGRRNATLLDPQRLGFAWRRGRRRFALAGRGRGPGGSLPTGWALELAPQRLGFACRRGRRFAL